MNQVRIITDRDLTDTEVNQIRDILLHSQCKNESLISSIKHCKGYADGEIHIYTGETETRPIVIEY